MFITVFQDGGMVKENPSHGLFINGSQFSPHQLKSELVRLGKVGLYARHRSFRL